MASEVATEIVREHADDDEGQYVQLNIVGEGHRQDALALIAGPKDFDGKNHYVGVTLRCEADNQADANAVRVEVMGQHVGYVSRDNAELLSPALQRACGGVLEGRGLIVGGWQRGDGDEGHYGIRVWITQPDCERIGVRADALDPTNHQVRWPAPPSVGPNERRLGPTAADIEAERYGSAVTVTCEEHYQSTIASSMPAGWNPARTWPLLVDLVISPSNPHASNGTPCIEVRFGDATIGYLTTKMSERHMEAVRACIAEGQRATAMATAATGTKGGASIKRIKVTLGP